MLCRVSCCTSVPLAMLLTAGCAGAQGPAADARAAAAAESTLLAADSALATGMARDPAAALADRFDVHGFVLWPDRPVLRGRAAADRLLGAPAATAGGRFAWRGPAHAGASADGTHGYTYGYATRGTAPARYLAYWRRDEGVLGSRWRVVAMVVTDAAPGTAPPAAACARDAPPQRSELRYWELRSADSAFSALASRGPVGAAFAAFAAPHGVLLGGAGGVTCGPSAIAAAFGAMPAGALVWAPTHADQAPSADLGYTIGTATAAGAAGAAPAFSKYLTVWRRMPGGAWRFAADAGNPAPAR